MRALSKGVAHRGGASLRPENTLAAFRHGLELGAKGIEFDVHLTRDGVAVVHHDPALKRGLARDSSGAWLSRTGPRIKDLTLEELGSYDVGRPDPDAAYALKHPELIAVDGERIPTLDAVLALAAEADAQSWVELKTSPLDPDEGAAPEELVDATLMVISDRGLLERVVVISFDWRALLLVREREPAVQLAFTTHPLSWFDERVTPPHVPEAWLQRFRAATRAGADWLAGFDLWRFDGSPERAIAAAGGDLRFAYHSDLGEEALHRAREEGVEVAAWTVNDPSEIRTLFEAGVVSLTSDRPDRVLAALEER